MGKRGMTPEQAKKLMQERGLGKMTKFKIARVKRGLSQGELSAASGVAKRTLQRYEQEPQEISKAKLGTLCVLCETLGCKIADIIDDEKLIEKFNKVK